MNVFTKQSWFWWSQHCFGESIGATRTDVEPGDRHRAWNQGRVAVLYTAWLCFKPFFCSSKFHRTEIPFWGGDIPPNFCTDLFADTSLVSLKCGTHQPILQRWCSLVGFYGCSCSSWSRAQAVLQQFSHFCWDLGTWEGLWHFFCSFSGSWKWSAWLRVVIGKVPLGQGLDFSHCCCFVLAACCSTFVLWVLVVLKCFCAVALHIQSKVGQKPPSAVWQLLQTSVLAQWGTWRTQSERRVLFSREFKTALPQEPCWITNCFFSPTLF